MQTTSLDRYDPPRGTLSTISTDADSRRNSKSSSYGIKPLFAAANGTGYREQTLETSVSVQLWYPNQTAPSTSTLSKAPILREVPQVKRKLARKERDSSNVMTETRSFSSLKSAAPSWLREKPSRTRLASQAFQVGQSKGVWKRATAICRDNGVLLLYGEDRALVHSIPAKDLQATDVRLVDDSLFSCPNVLGIFSRPSTFNAGARSPQPGNSRLSQTGKDEPIYLCFPSSRKMKRWRGLLRTFAKPEIYGSPQKGGTHRCYRQIDMTIQEAKLVSARPAMATRSNGVISPTLDEDEDGSEAAAANGLGISTNSDFGNRQSTDDAHLAKTLSEVTRKSIGSVSHLSVDSEVEVQIKTASLSETDEDSDQDIVSGPISGISGRDRIVESSPMTSNGSGYDMERKGSDGQLNTVHSTCYCLVWMAGEVVAQTKVRSGPSNVMTWYDKFSFKDLPNLHAVQIDVMHSGRSGKFGILGTVNLPMDTMRRGERLEGWFPIWSTRTRELDSFSTPTEACYGDEMMGEIKIDITINEETVLPLKKYAQVDEAIHASDCVSLMQALSKELDEDRIVSHLVDIYTSKGTIVERLCDLTEAESANFGENLGPALLFRSNTLLTRAVDKYQRLYCKDWLDACIGPTVRRICQDRIWLEANESLHYYLNPFPSQADGSLSSSHSTTTVVVENNLDALQRLCKEMWNSIYSNRHRCPKDLRIALSNIRSTVNARFQQANHVPAPGIQGVGAFVFLRLICPAITTPHLYGLMGSAPNVASSKTLMLVAKVFLGLANKRIAFDKDKEPWLVQANDFLLAQAEAYDDFITFVSTKPSMHESVRESWGDEADFSYQKQVKELSNGLLVLHRESIPSQDYMLDQSLAFASLVSFVVRSASVEVYKEGQNPRQSEDATRRYDHFVDMCCDIEDQAGYYVDRAGYNPEPIDVVEVSRAEKVGVKSTQVYTGDMPQPAATASAAPPPTSSTLDRSESTPSVRMRRATVSEGRAGGGDGGGAQRAGRMSPAGEESSMLRRLPLRFGPHLKSLTGRSSLESDEDSSTKSLPHQEEAEMEPRMSAGQIGSSSSHFHRNTSIEAKARQREEESIRSEDQSSLRRMRRGWWKKS